MPQMSPMMWLLLFNYFLLISLIAALLIYFLFFSYNVNFNQKSFNLLFKKYLNKW
nr:ATP synthase F0 subunit 8 [Walkerella microcarpae]